MTRARDPAPVPRTPMRETVIAQVMTSTSVGSHPTAFTATGLPILRIALDVDAVSPALLPLLAPLAVDSGPPKVRYARLLAYKQGNRGTIHYDVSVGADQLDVVGKLYPQPDQVARVNALLQALWGRVFAARPPLEVPRPLGTVPDLKMLVYVPVTGTSLDDVLLTGGAVDAARGAASWLATLHGADLDLDRRLDPAVELVNLHAWASLVARSAPAEAERAGRLAGELEASAGVLSGATTTPIHKDFHYKHVLIDGGVRVIDFDEVRLGDPVYDVAHFCTHLWLLACRNTSDAARIAVAEGAFLDTYQRETGRRLGDSYAWYGAYTCMKIAKQLCTVRGVRPRPDGDERLRQVSSILDQGVALSDGLR